MTTQLLKFIVISGVGAASGLVYLDDKLYIIGDNSGFLYEYHLTNKSLQKYPFLDNAAEFIAKNEKPDVESITLKNNKLYIFGSGSTKKRNARFRFDLATKTFKNKDIAKLYKRYRNFANLKEDELNIEGSFFVGSKQYSFLRGNKNDGNNGVFVFDKATKTLNYHIVELPFLSKVEASFTDAICFENKIYFLAAAEDTDSTYNDGEILGSIFGIMNLETFAIEYTTQIAENQKFEGLTFYKKENNTLHFLLCEDNDTTENVTTIFEFVLSL